MASPRVLIVDDEDYILQILSFSLQAEGWDVITASDGEKALDAVGEFGPDLVVLDLMMPVMDGYQVLKQLKGCQDTRHIPVIVLTAKGRDLDRQIAVESGADDYITKPFSPQRLVERIHEKLAAGQSPAAGS